MHAIHWKTEISAAWKRALELKDIRLANDRLFVEVEEETGKRWMLDFGPTQAWKVTTEECAGTIVAALPAEGALFKIQSSKWLQQLGDAQPLHKSQHFVICCYDEIVEVLAWDCAITPAPA